MYPFFKRFIDFSAALIVMILIFPLMVIISIIIYLQDFNNPVFVHKRVGRNGKLINFYKFRSMPVNSPLVESHQIDKLTITPFGKVLRRTNLDELPQLWLIIMGDMSLIGPRPSIPSQTMLNDLRKENGSISLRPGLTGWAQVNSYDNMPDSTKAEFDGFYFQNISLWLDIKIFFKTIIYLTKTPPSY